MYDTKTGIRYFVLNCFPGLHGIQTSAHSIKATRCRFDPHSDSCDPSFHHVNYSENTQDNLVLGDLFPYTLQLKNI